MSSLAVELPNEIQRVRQVQDEYKSLRGMSNVIVEPQIAMMEAAIVEGTKALGSGDVVRMIRAFENLKGFEA